MIPDGWKLTPIKNICECIVDCVNKTAPVVEEPTSFKMIRTTNVRNGRVDIKNVNFVTEDTYRKWVRRGRPKSGDIILTREAPVGEVGILEDDKGVFLGQRTVMYRADPKKILSRLLLYSLQGRHCQKQIEDFSNGGTVAHMRVPDCGEILVKIPPLPEQAKIVKILYNWDRAIELTERLIAEKRLRRKGLVQQLLTGNRRLPGFGKPAIGGYLPEGWRRPKTEEVFQNVSRKNCPGETVLSVTQDEGVVPRASLDRKINMDHENTHTYKLVEPGDFVISLRSFQGGLEYSRFRGLVRPAYHVIRATVDVSDDFFRIYFKSPEFIQRLAIATIGIRDGKQISYGDFSFMRLPLPPVKEQQAIASVINMADRELDLLQAKAEALREQKKALCSNC